MARYPKDDDAERERKRIANLAAAQARRDAEKADREAKRAAFDKTEEARKIDERIKREAVERDRSIKNRKPKT